MFSLEGNVPDPTSGFLPSEPPTFMRKPNGDDTTAPILLGIGGALVFISLSLLLARVWSRLRPVAHLHWDDWTVIIATALGIINYIILSTSVFYGLGRHARFVSFRRRKISLELLFISQVVWYWSITMVKISVACLLLRIKRDKRWRYFMFTLMGILICALITQTCFQFLQCRPFRIYWDPSVAKTQKVQCLSREVINTNIVAFSSIQVSIDLIFSAIPIAFISKLNRPRREKIFLSVLMALGLFASIAAIIRTLFLQSFYTSRDLFRTNVYIALWAVVEQQFALIAATAPTLKAFLEKTLIKIGLFFYDAKSESQVRSKLVGFGLLDEEEEREKARANQMWTPKAIVEKKLEAEARMAERNRIECGLDEYDDRHLSDKEFEDRAFEASIGKFV